MVSQKGSLSVRGRGMPPAHHRTGNLPARGGQHSQPHQTTPHRGKAGFQSTKLQGLSVVSQMWSAKDQRVWGSCRKEGWGPGKQGLLCRCLFYILQFLLNLDSASTPLKMVNISDCIERDFEIKQNVFNLPESTFPHLCNAGLLWGNNEIIRLSA